MRIPVIWSIRVLYMFSLWPTRFNDTNGGVTIHLNRMPEVTNVPARQPCTVDLHGGVAWSTCSVSMTATLAGIEFAEQR